ncbi:hypothetical protein MTR67_045341 [Solanum verrucosum]|uniref:DUF4283 domain-containing protein n=1 Tax=Solanum verrucosum TaxID=315347 RepID=A0AAF0UVQ9_SOLVR|nr:hypothetical protein MTR67_045341 [Solanum verrucosum]
MAQEATLGKAPRGKKAQSVVLQENSQVETELNNPETPPKVTMEISKLEAPEHWADVVHTSASSSKFFPSSSGAKSWADQVEAEIPISKASIWDNFDISKVSNAGFKLDYVAPEMQGEIPITVIELGDIESEINYWKIIVICYVLGAHPPFDVDELYMVPIWIKLPGLDFKYRSPKGLSKLGSLVGKPLMVDHNTEKKKGLHFAKLLVEVKMDAKLPEVILFKNEKDLIVNPQGKYGHSEDECRKKKAPVQRQRPEKQVAPLEVTSDVVLIAHGVEVDSQETQVVSKNTYQVTSGGIVGGRTIPQSGNG